MNTRSLLVLLAVTASQLHAEEWQPLFNGKDLDGWTAKIRGYEAGDNYADTFRVEDGLLKVRYDKYEGPFKNRFGHLFYDTPYSHYRLRVEYRVVGEQIASGPPWANRNSGLMLHGQSPQSMPKEQSFPVSLEIQLLGGQGKGSRPTANLCTPGTNVVLDGKLDKRHCISSASPTFEDNEWVTVEVELRGDESVKHFVNGELVMEYTKPQYDPRDSTATPLIKDGELALTGGTISLQSESHPFDFRRVELMPLPTGDEG